MTKSINASLSTSNKKKIAKYADGTLTQAEIARAANVSREYVRQVVNVMRLPVKTNPAKYCSDCGTEIERSRVRCKKCQLLSNERSKVTLSCQQCKKKFTITKSEYDGRNRDRKLKVYFCSQQCFGSYIGKTHGKSALTSPLTILKRTFKGKINKAP